MNELSMIDELALLALMGGKNTPLTPRALGTEMERLSGMGNLDAAAALTSLSAREYIEELPREKGQRSSRWCLCPSGKNVLQTRLGGLSQGKGWKQKAARVIAACHGLGVSPELALAFAKTNDALPAYFLALRLGEQFAPGITTAQALAGQTAAAALVVPNGEPLTLWRAVFQRGSTSESVKPAEEIDTFAVDVQRAAQSAREGWFGPRKIFINRAWTAWQSSTGRTLDLPTFKSRLLRGLRAGELGLTRADFTVGLNPVDLSESEIRDGDETFHFLSSEKEGQQ